MSPSKRCFCCGDIRPLVDFYTHKAMADGHLNKCKECVLDYAWLRRRTTPERMRAIDAAKYQKHKERNRAQRRAYRKRRRSTNAEKYYACGAVSRAVKAGVIHRPPECSRCGHVAKVHGHHEDYSKPLEVEWLCVVCHMQLHHCVRRRVRSEMIVLTNSSVKREVSDVVG